MPDDFQTITDDTSPEYKLVFEEHPGYFFACVEARLTTPEIAAAYQQKIAHEIDIRKYDRVMIKRDVPLDVLPAGLCTVMYKVRNWSMRSIKYAFVDVNPGHLHAYKFAILYAVSQGIEVEVFADIETAEEWLMA